MKSLTSSQVAQTLSRSVYCIKGGPSARVAVENTFGARALTTLLIEWIKHQEDGLCPAKRPFGACESGGEQMFGPPQVRSKSAGFQARRPVPRQAVRQVISRPGAGGNLRGAALLELPRFSFAENTLWRSLGLSVRRRSPQSPCDS